MSFDFDDIVEEIKDELVENTEAPKREIDDATGYALELIFVLREYFISEYKNNFFSKIERILQLMFGYGNVSPVEFKIKEKENDTAIELLYNFQASIKLKNKFRNERDVIFFFRTIEDVRMEFQQTCVKPWVDGFIKDEFIRFVYINEPYNNKWISERKVQAIWPFKGNYDVWNKMNLKTKDYFAIHNNFNIIYDVMHVAKSKLPNKHINVEKILNMLDDDTEKIITATKKLDSHIQFKDNIVDIQEPGFLSRNFCNLKDDLIIRPAIDIIPCGRNFIDVNDVSIESIFESQVKQQLNIRYSSLLNRYSSLIDHIMLGDIELKKLSLYKMTRESFMRKDELMVFHVIDLVSKAIYLEDIDTDVFLRIKIATNEQLSNLFYPLENIISDGKTLNVLRQYIKPAIEHYYQAPSGIYVSNSNKMYILKPELL